LLLPGLPSMSARHARPTVPAAADRPVIPDTTPWQQDPAPLEQVASPIASENRLQRPRDDLDPQMQMVAAENVVELSAAVG
jgi:hypothetical protein